MNLGVEDEEPMVEGDLLGGQKLRLGQSRVTLRLRKALNPSIDGVVIKET